jgi:hypothetical protein
MPPRIRWIETRRAGYIPAPVASFTFLLKTAELHCAEQNLHQPRQWERRRRAMKEHGQSLVARCRVCLRMAYRDDSR